MNSRGFSLIEAAISLGILVLVAGGGAYVSYSIINAKGRSESSSAFMNYERSFVAGVSQAVDAVANTGGSCTGGAGGIVAAISPINFNGEGTSTPSAAILYPAADPDAAAAVERCKTPKGPADINAPGAYYLCYQFARSGTAQGRNLFLDAEAAFAEVRVNFVDMSAPASVFGYGGAKPLSCTQFIASPIGGSISLAIYYRIYWKRPGDTNGYFSYSNTAYIPKWR